MPAAPAIRNATKAPNRHKIKMVNSFPRLGSSIASLKWFQINDFFKVRLERIGHLDLAQAQVCANTTFARAHPPNRRSSGVLDWPFPRGIEAGGRRSFDGSTACSRLGARGGWVGIWGCACAC